MRSLPRLERWIQYGDCLVGYAFDDRRFTPGQRVVTDAIRFVDLQNFEAETLQERWKLGEPGTKDEHSSNPGLIYR